MQDTLSQLGQIERKDQAMGGIYWCNDVRNSEQSRPLTLNTSAIM